MIVSTAHWPRREAAPLRRQPTRRKAAFRLLAGGSVAGGRSGAEPARKRASVRIPAGGYDGRVDDGEGRVPRARQK
eukprot:1093831-Prymnesium_polylepis.1